MTVQVTGVLEAPAKTATKPSAAKRSTGPPSRLERAFPSAAPIKNRGVTSPPLNPDLLWRAWSMMGFLQEDP
jgi:hypothetical protein